MPLLDQIKFNAAKVRNFVTREGFAVFFHYAVVTAILGMADLLLYPFKRRSCNEIFYDVFDNYVEKVNGMDNPRILEIGSRNVKGTVRRSLFTGNCEYTGFDIIAGENVDVVGDVHRLSSILKPEYYDAVFSVSVFEHLAMPWKAVLEINRVMKPGGLLYISTHPTFPPHELPWDFWRFSPEAFKVLLNPHCGFEITECVEGNPARIISLAKDPATLKMFLSRVNQSIAVTATKKGEVDGRLNWGVGTEELLETMYPTNTK